MKGRVTAHAVQTCGLTLEPLPVDVDRRFSIQLVEAKPEETDEIEVTLTDTQNRALARKVFAPADYLAASGEPRSRVDGGLAACHALAAVGHARARRLRACG